MDGTANTSLSLLDLCHWMYLEGFTFCCIQQHHRWWRLLQSWSGQRGFRQLLVDSVWNVISHAQKPDFVFRRNGQVHLNRQERQFSRLLAAEVCASAVVMLGTPCSEVVWRILATHSIQPVSSSLPLPCVTVCHHISTGLCLDWGQLFIKTTGSFCVLRRLTRLSAYILLKLTFITY